VANLDDNRIVVKLKAECFYRDFCGTIALVMVLLERSSDTLAQAETIAREMKPLLRTTSGGYKARDNDANHACNIGHLPSPDLAAANLKYARVVRLRGFTSIQEYYIHADWRWSG
jgi:hypothetical protein